MTDRAWRDVEAEIERRNASGYAWAVDLPPDLRAVADERDGLPAFTGRVAQIRERYAKKARFLQRIVGLV